MTAKKPDAKVLSQDFIPRPHYACRVRLDILELIKSKCTQLNISQGVFLEILVSKALLMDAITEKDVYQYSNGVRWLHRVVDDYKKTGVMLGSKNLDQQTRDKLIQAFAKVVQGENPPDRPVRGN